MLLGADAGLRQGEIIALEWGDPLCRAGAAAATTSVGPRCPPVDPSRAARPFQLWPTQKCVLSRSRFDGARSRAKTRPGI